MDPEVIAVKPWIYWLVASTQTVDTLRQMFASMGDGGPAELSNFTIPIVLKSNTSQVVAYGGSTGPVSEEAANNLEQNVFPSLPPEVIAAINWVRVHNSDDDQPRIAKTSNAETQARINAGEVLYYDMPGALDKVGLQIKPI